jgi:hypothetical protein
MAEEDGTRTKAGEIGFSKFAWVGDRKLGIFRGWYRESDPFQSPGEVPGLVAIEVCPL